MQAEGFQRGRARAMLLKTNFPNRRCFFDSVLGKFGIGSHVFSPLPLHQRDAEWQMIDHALVNWLYTTIAKSVFDNVYKPDSFAYTVWCDKISSTTKRWSVP
jgi:hypothetical protein